MKKLVCHGLAAPFVINGITVNVMKPACFSSGLEKKVCLTRTLSTSDSFHCIDLLVLLFIFAGLCKLLYN